MNFRTWNGLPVRAYLGNGHTGDPLPALDVHHRMAELQRNAEVIEALDDVPLQSAGIGHQLRNHQNLGPLQGHAPGHDQADIAAAQDDHSAPRQEALNVHQPLGRTGGVNARRAEARDVQRAPAPLPAAHGQDDGGGFDFNQTVGAVDGGDLLVLADGQHHGVQLVGNAPVQYLPGKAGGVFRAGELLAEGV